MFYCCSLPKALCFEGLSDPETETMCLQCRPLGMKEEEESFMTQDKFQAGKLKVSGGIFVGESRMLGPVNEMKK